MKIKILNFLPLINLHITKVEMPTFFKTSFTVIKLDVWESTTI